MIISTQTFSMQLGASISVYNSLLHSFSRSQFIAHFTKELYCLLEIKLASSTAWHPQTNGQTEHINQELDQYLQLFVNKWQDDWYDLLFIVEFQYNNHVHSATQ